MATGMNTPVKASRSGGTEFLRNARQKAKILREALSAGDDKNPFQDLGVKERAVFQLDDAFAGSEIKAEVQRILNKFVEILVVNPDRPLTVVRDPDRGFGVEFEWIDLETNEVFEFSQFLQNPGASNG